MPNKSLGNISGSFQTTDVINESHKLAQLIYSHYIDLAHRNGDKFYEKPYLEDH